LVHLICSTVQYYRNSTYLEHGDGVALHCKGRVEPLLHQRVQVALPYTLPTPFRKVNELEEPGGKVPGSFLGTRGRGRVGAGWQAAQVELGL